jgi:hypothetical protein
MEESLPTIRASMREAKRVYLKDTSMREESLPTIRV